MRAIPSLHSPASRRHKAAANWPVACRGEERQSVSRRPRRLPLGPAILPALGRPALALEVERAAVDGGQFPAGEAESSDPLRLLGAAQRTEVVDFIFPGGMGHSKRR